MPLNVIMMGPPGAGKGTQAERFATRRGVPKISTGDILREAAHQGTPLGRQAQAIMDRGDLVGDDVMIGIVRDRLGRDDALRGFVLDGFPRTVAQAQALDHILAGRGPLVVVDIVVPEGELARRLRGRRICSVCGYNAAGFKSSDGTRTAVPAGHTGLVCRLCGGALVSRADDDDRVLVERLKVYHRDTEPLVDFYRARSSFRSIDGAQSPEHVAAELAAAVDAVLEAKQDASIGHRTEEAR